MIIHLGAFCDCKALGDIQFPDSLQEIGTIAFHGCDSLTTVELSEGLKEIERGAFSYCRSLRKALLPSTVLFIDDCNGYSDSDTFGGTKNLTIYCYSGTDGLEFGRKYGYPIKRAAAFHRD